MSAPEPQPQLGNPTATDPAAYPDSATAYAAAYYETVPGADPHADVQQQQAAYDQAAYADPNYQYYQYYGQDGQQYAQYPPEYYQQQGYSYPANYGGYDYNAYYQHYGQYPPQQGYPASYPTQAGAYPPASALPSTDPTNTAATGNTVQSTAATVAANLNKNPQISVTGKFQLKPQLSASAAQYTQVAHLSAATQAGYVTGAPPQQLAAAAAARDPKYKPAYTPVPPSAPPPQIKSIAKPGSRLPLGSGGAGSGAPMQFSAVSGNFPPALKIYLDRCLSAVGDSTADRAIMMKVLKDAITKKMQKGEMWTTDWAKEPLIPLPDLSNIRRNDGDSAGPRGPISTRVTLEDDPRSARTSPKANKNDKKRKNEKKGDLKSRLAFSSVHDRLQEADSDSELDEAERARRAKRFGAEKGKKRKIIVDYDDEDYYEGAIIVGTCQDLEKSYFRLQAAPDPATVRPQHILERALTRLENMLREGKGEYFYFEDQFKGIRQDCTIQHLKNDFTVRVYESHARAALDYGDLGEFNQCQTQLITLYADGHRGSQVEFHAYRILYGTVNASKGLSTEIARALKATTPNLRAAPEVQHALKVRSAIFQGDYSAFFRLYASCPNKGQRILDAMLEPVRFETVKRMASAYKPTIEISFLVPALIFDSLEGGGDSTRGYDAAVQWMEKHGAQIKRADPKDKMSIVLDCTPSLKTLFMPKDEDAVAHGDANLSLDKFLAAFN